MPVKKSRVQVRIEPDLRARIDTAIATTGIPEPVIVTKCLEAYCTYVEQQGEITFPLSLKPKGVEPVSPTLATGPQHVGKADKQIVKAKRSQLRDIQEISLPIFGTIPAGWPSDNQSIKAKRVVKVPGGKYPSNAFGLEVSGNSMNKAVGKFGPILNGEIVVLVPFETIHGAKGKIVAALNDGQTTLKRLNGVSGGRLELTSETEDSSANRKIIPEYDLVVQGVVIDKLNHSGK